MRSTKLVKQAARLVISRALLLLAAVLVVVVALVVGDVRIRVVVIGSIARACRRGVVDVWVGSCCARE